MENIEYLKLVENYKELSGNFNKMGCTVQEFIDAINEFALAATQKNQFETFIKMEESNEGQL